ncbi:unnamed protein product, partial [Ectocarpus fasciculatus]
INTEAVENALEKLRPPSLPDMAAVPAGALDLPQSYVERAAVQEVADGLTSPEESRLQAELVGSLALRYFLGESGEGSEEQPPSSPPGPGQGDGRGSDGCSARGASRA